MEDFNYDFVQHLDEESFAWFLSWHLWVEIPLNVSIVEKCCILIQKNIRDEKVCFLMSYIHSYRS